MALTPILPQQFSTVLDLLTDPTVVYFIPTFQRPYAWGAMQIEDLGRDMEKAQQFNGHHYLSAIHLLEHYPANPDVRLQDFAGHAHEVFAQAMQNGALLTNNMNPVRVYAVVDGQQRLTTLFLLAHIYYHSRGNPANRQSLEAQTLAGHSIPRLIQTTVDDHAFMMGIVEHIWNPTQPLPVPLSRSQARMLDSFKIMHAWAEQPRIDFLISLNFRTSAIVLDVDYGLTAFMSLNDRGKPLTVLEKLKALLLQFVYEAHRAQIFGAQPLINVLHSTFGDLYRVVDRCLHVELFGEGDYEAVRLISCYIRLDSDAAAIWQGADQAYESFFRNGLWEAKIAAIPSLVGGWVDRVREVATQLDHLVDCITNRPPVQGQPSLHIPGFPLSTDYRAVLLSLGLQPHLLALLLKFRAQYGAVEWHERFAVAARAFDLQPIQHLLNDIANRAGVLQPPSPLALGAYIAQLLEREIQPKPEMSMLEIVERMQMVDWNLGSRRKQGFVYYWGAMANQQGPADCIQQWLGWRSCDDFVSSILNRHVEANLRYLLKEGERDQGGDLYTMPFQPNISTGIISLEHIFAQNIEAHPGFLGFHAYGIADRAEYQEKVLWRSGNFTLLSEYANPAAGNATPEIKGAHYANCPGHPALTGNNLCSDIGITYKAGTEMVALGNHLPSFRLYIEARCAELALFALKRFC
jgi:hypothetical protein